MGSNWDLVPEGQNLLQLYMSINATMYFEQATFLPWIWT